MVESISKGLKGKCDNIAKFVIKIDKSILQENKEIDIDPLIKALRKSTSTLRHFSLQNGDIEKQKIRHYHGKSFGMEVDFNLLSKFILRESNLIA